MKEDFVENKLPGKTLYSGRRRPATRRSGFKVHADASGGEFQCREVPTFVLPKGETLRITMTCPRGEAEEFVGFGGWFSSDHPLDVVIVWPMSRYLLKYATYPDWGKFGALWTGGTERAAACITFTGGSDTLIAIWGLCAGIVKEKLLPLPTTLST